MTQNIMSENDSSDIDERKPINDRRHSNINMSIDNVCFSE